MNLNISKTNSFQKCDNILYYCMLVFHSHIHYVVEYHYTLAISSVLQNFRDILEKVFQDFGYISATITGSEQLGDFQNIGDKKNIEYYAVK